MTDCKHFVEFFIYLNGVRRNPFPSNRNPSQIFVMDSVIVNAVYVDLIHFTVVKNILFE